MQTVSKLQLFLCICVFSVTAERTVAQSASPASSPPAAASPAPRSETRPSNVGPRALEDVFQEEFEQVIGERKDDSAFQAERRAVAETIEAIGSEDSTIRFDAEFMLGKIARRVDLPVIIEALKTYALKPQSQMAVIRVLGKMGDRRAVDPLKKEFEYVNREVQLTIVDALGDIKDESTVPLFANLLRSTREPDYIFHALSALAKVGDNRAIYAIESSYSLLPEGSARLAAKWSLDVAKKVVRPDYTNTEFQPGRKSVFFYKGMLYFFFRPTTLHRDTSDPQLLVCIHGTALDAENIYDICAQAVKERRLAVLAPFFDPVYFPDYHQLNVRGERSDSRLLELIDFFGQNMKVKTDRFYLYGFERGGEFAQRFAFAHPDRIFRAVFLTSFVHSLNENEQFPVGLKSTPVVADLSFSLEQILRMEFASIVDPVIQSSRAFKNFVATFDAEAERRSLLTPYRILQVQKGQANAVMGMKAALSFMFPPRELQPLVEMVPTTGFTAGGNPAFGRR